MKTFLLFICALAATAFLYRFATDEFATYERRQKEAERKQKEAVELIERALLVRCKQTYGASAERRLVDGRMICCKVDMYSLKCEALPL